MAQVTIEDKQSDNNEFYHFDDDNLSGNNSICIKLIDIIDTKI